MAILEGNSRENTMDSLYSQIFSLQNELAKDEKALSWFNLVTVTPAVPCTPELSQFSSSPSNGLPFPLFNHFPGVQGAVARIWGQRFQGGSSLFQIGSQSNYST
jgi:hypothetical protein